MEFRLDPSGPGAADRAGGSSAEEVLLVRSGTVEPPVAVRPVASESTDDWAPVLDRALGLSRGVVGVTSKDTGVAARLAADLAAWSGERGRSVVLVDCCIEQPVISKPLPEDGDEGIVDAAAFGVTPESVLRRTLSTGVRVVTAGSHPLSVEAVLESNGFASALGRFAEEALVLVVLPPSYVKPVLSVLDGLLAVADSRDAASALLEGARTDARRVIAVVAADATRREAEAPRVDLPEAPTSKAGLGAGTPGLHPLPGDLGARGERGERAQEARGPAQDGAAEPAEPETSAGGESLRRLVMYAPAMPARKRRRVRAPAVVAAVVIVGTAAALFWFTLGPGAGSPEPTGTRESAGVQTAEGDGLGTAPHAGSDTARVVRGTSGDTAAQTQERVEQHERTEHAPPPAEAPLSGPGGRYVVYVSSHRQREAAGVSASELRKQNVEARIVRVDLPERGVWFRVAVAGGFPRLADAREVLDTVKRLGYEGAWIERSRESQ